MYNLELGSWWARSLINQGVVVYDTETTGLNKAQVIEIALVDGGSGIKLFESFVKPLIPIEPGAFAVHGITMEMLKDAPSMLEVIQSVFHIVGDRPMAAYNSDYDYRVMQNSCKAVGAHFEHDQTWCIMHGYKMYADFPKQVRLENACKQMGVVPGQHRALGDSQAAAGLLQGMADMRLPDYSIDPVLAHMLTGPTAQL